MSIRAALVLAAGKGTRMHSDRPKVLQLALGEPMLAYVLAALEPDFGENIWAVIGHGAEMVKEALPGRKYVFQEEQLGTGHALKVALPALAEAKADEILVINGDAPLVTAGLLHEFVERAQGCDLAFATITLDNPGSYGRVVRVDGEIEAIVEAKDYDKERYGAESGEVNAGLYYMKASVAEALLPRVSNENKSGEYYITDLVALALQDGLRVEGVVLGHDESLLGVNSPFELMQAEELLRRRRCLELLKSGVILHAPDSVRVSPFSVVEPGAEVSGPCEIAGKSVIRSGARIFSNCVLCDAVVEKGAQIRPFTHVEKALVHEGALVGPYARLRPGAELGRSSHVGNFVELKKTFLGEGAKANHLSYLGDTTVGPKVNIGAGTITCNYDGKNKFRTEIGANAFIGSNTALVAPVKVGAGALVGAGSTITKDVGENELAIARSRQANLPRRLK